MPTSSVSSAAKTPGTVLSVRPSPTFLSLMYNVAVLPLSNPPPSYLNSTRPLAVPRSQTHPAFTVS